MSQRNGHPLKAVRLGHDRISLDFTLQGQRVRGVVTAEALAALVRGEVDHESNLPLGKVPIRFADYVKSNYIPFSVTRRLKNPKSYDAEIDLVKALEIAIANKFLHEIDKQDAKHYREEWIEKGDANTTVKKRLYCLGRIIEEAVDDGILKSVFPLPVKGLPKADRTSMWFKLPQINLLLPACPATIGTFTEFSILSGARVNEGLDLREGDIDLVNGKLWLPTEKHGVPQRQEMRELNITSLGPRFAHLLPRLRPHQKTGFYFTARAGRPMSESCVGKNFNQALVVLGPAFKGPDGKTKYTFHDTRRTFMNHRKPFVNFDRLMYETGHEDPASVRSYFDRPRPFNPRDSIFYGATFESMQPPTPAPTSATTGTAVTALPSPLSH